MKPAVATFAFPADAENAQWPEGAIEVGRIIGAWGVKGWVKVQTFSSDPQALFSSKRWFVEAPEPFKGQRLFKVVHAKSHGGVVVAQLAACPDRNTAESLKGVRIFVPRESFPTPDTDEYYWVDLIGMTVVNREGITLGQVQGLLDTGPHSVLRITPPGGAEAGSTQEVLVPFVKAYVDDVSLSAKRITVDWGLDY